MTADDKLGILLLRRELPSSRSDEISAIEARLLPTQDVPPRSELHFFGVRGDAHEHLSVQTAAEVMRAQFSARSVAELSQFELLVEAAALSTENVRMRPVYAAALDWRRHVNLGPAHPLTKKLIEVIDAAIDAEEHEECGG